MPSEKLIFGELSGIEVAMLMLAGYSLIDVWASWDIDDNTFEANMKRGHELLVWLTGHDFGYDLLKWHEFLLLDPRAYFWRGEESPGWRDVLEAAESSERRIRIVRKLEANA